MTKQLSRKRLAGFVLGAFVVAFFAASSAHADLKNVSGPGGHSYDVVVDQNATWSQAKAAATATGGHLVTINSAAEQAFVEQLLTNASAPAGEYWIGLKKTGGISPGATTTADYGWTTGEPQNFQHWLASQPDNNPTTSATELKALIEPSFHLPFSQVAFGFLGLGAGANYITGHSAGFAQIGSVV